MNQNDLLELASYLPRSVRIPSSWVGHLPFAAWLIQELSPSVFVELGTHTANSYFAFCQAVVECGLSTKCYAVDTWRGDAHAGEYGDEVFSAVEAYNHEHYGGFSRLLRMRFDEAAARFSNGSIELLHIDGLHTYEAVRHDFETWLPRLAPGAVVLLHDTNVREGDFGVWRFWEELQAEYSSHLEFVHSHGLGVLQLNNAPEDKKREWLQPGGERQRLIRYFAALGMRHLERFELNEHRRRIAGLDQALCERDGQISRLNQTITERKARVSVLNQTVAERDGQIASLRHALDERHEQIAGFNEALSERDAAAALVNRMENSFSWRLTRPLRFIARVYRQWLRADRQRLIQFARRMYHRMPLPLKARAWLKAAYMNRQTFMDTDITRSLIQNRNSLIGLAEIAGRYDPSHPWFLLVDLFFPSPDKDSGSVRMSGILSLLREQGFLLTFAADSGEEQNRYRQELQKHGIETLQGYSAILEHLGQHGGKYRYVVLSRPEIAFRYLPAVRAFALNSEVVYDTVDLHWVRMEREMEVSGNRGLKEQIDHYRRIELFNTACSDMVLAITPEEKSRLLEEKPNVRVEILPNIHDPQPLATPFDQRKGLMFIGGFWHKPNKDAVRYFVDQILPQVVAVIPDIVFYIVGSNMPQFIKSMRSEHVEPLGYISDVRPCFSSCRVFVAPLRYGAGMKGKIGQSIAYGLPVVTTTIGAEGTGLMDGQHILLADTPGAFAHAVIRLYTESDLWHRLSANALDHLQEHYSMAAARRRLVAMFPLPAASGSGALHKSGETWRDLST